MKNSLRMISGFLTMSLVLSVFVIFSAGKVSASEVMDSATNPVTEKEVFWHSMASDLYYSQLSDIEKKVWDRLDDACMEVLLSDGDVNNYFGEVYYIAVNTNDLGIDYNRAEFIASLFINSNPQYFFLNGFGSSPNADKTAYNVLVTVYSEFHYGSVRTNARECLEAEAKFYLARAAEKSRPEEKERVIHDLMRDKISYDDNFECVYNQSAYSAALGKTVCAGYSKFFEAMMNACGIRCGYVTGPGHAWNIINLHGYWYYVDVTNDDTKTIAGAYRDNFYNTNVILTEVGKIDDEIKGYIPAVSYDGLETTTANKYSSRYFTVNGVTYFIVNDLDNPYGRLALIVNDVQSTQKTVQYNSKTYSVINYTEATVPAADPEEQPADTPADPPADTVTDDPSDTPSDTSSEQPDETLTVAPAVTYAWKKISGNWYYVGSDGTKAKGFVKIDNVTYYFDKNGIMKTGWQLVDGSYYYMNKSGVMLTGWQKISKKWYYLDKADGKMLTGLNKVDGKWYFFNTSGALQTGWKQINGKWYYLTSNGAYQSCWKKISKKWYYFDGKAKAVTGLQTIDGTTYLFSSGGIMQTGWQKIDGKWYYFKGGAMVCGQTLKINGKKYSFSADGVML